MQAALTKTIIETDHQDCPKIRIQAHAMHCNITKFLYFFTPGNTYPASSHKIKSMLNKELLYSSTSTKVDMPHGTQGTCV